MQPLPCSRHNVNVIQKEKPEEKAGERQPCSSLYWRGGAGGSITLGSSDATGTTTGWQLAQSTHCFGWSRLEKLGKIPPPAPGQNCHKQSRKTDLGRKEGAAVFTGWALQLCSLTPREKLPKRGMAGSGTEAAACPPGHIWVSLLVRARAPWPQPCSWCSQESPGHGSSCGCAPGTSACLVLHP